MATLKLNEKDFSVTINKNTDGFTAWFEREGQVYDRRSYKTVKAAERSAKKWLADMVATAYA